MKLRRYNDLKTSWDQEIDVDVSALSPSEQKVFMKVANLLGWDTPESIVKPMMAEKMSLWQRFKALIWR